MNKKELEKAIAFLRDNKTVFISDKSLYNELVNYKLSSSPAEDCIRYALDGLKVELGIDFSTTKGKTVMLNVETMKQARVYIAGPMRGKPQFNYPAFSEAERELKKLGYEVINPATMGDKYGTAEEINADRALLERLMLDELRVVATCDAIYLLRGWEKSVGARRELALALQLDLLVIEQKVGR